MRKLTWHTDTSEGARIVQTGTVVLTRVRLTLVDVGLTARTGEPLGAVAHERTRRVDADTVVFARRSCNMTWVTIINFITSTS